MSALLQGRGWRGEITCPLVPAQVEGSADGVYFYFRNRHYATWFGVGDSSDAAVEAAMELGERVEYGGELDLDDAVDRLTATAWIDRLLMSSPDGS